MNWTRSEIMLIVALQDDLGHYAIWDTNDKKFLGVNLTVHGAIAKILDNRRTYTYEDAIEKLEHAQPFSEIAAHISVGNFSDEEKTLKEKIHDLEEIIDTKLGGWTKDRKYGLSLTELTTALEKADKYDKIKKWLKKEIKYTRKNMPFLYKND